MTYRRPLITIATREDLDALERAGALFARRSPGQARGCTWIDEDEDETGPEDLAEEIAGGYL